MEIIGIIIVILLGILAGTITGLIPGIHINLIATLILINTAILLKTFNLNQLTIFIISMSITHTFVDFIPSIIFGIPSEDTALSILPAHQLVLSGQAYKSIHLSSLGSLFGMLFALIITPLLLLILKPAYNTIKCLIPYILILTLISLILSEKTTNKKFWALIIVLFAGGLGMFTLNTTIINEPLLILFTGLFGTASIIQSMRSENSSFPPQTFKSNCKLNKQFLKAITIGGLCSSVCSITPGIGNAQAGTLATLFFKKIPPEIFIIILSAINTINFIISIITLYLLDKARNGSINAISQITENIITTQLITYLAIVFIVAIVAFFLTLKLGKKIIKTVTKINFKLLNLTILIILILLVTIMTNPFGLLILLCATSLGILTTTINVRRVHMMAVLLIPVILNLT